MPFLLEATGISKRFGGIAALTGAELRIAEPGIVGLIGPNGAGKTTLFDVICGEQAADAGEVRLAGQRIDRLPPHRRARLGLARSFQECRVLVEETCLDNMLFAAQDKRLGREFARLPSVGGGIPHRAVDAAQELLGMVGLQRFAHRRAGEMSFGQRRLLEIASLLLTRPAVLLLDEPASGVNPTLLNTLHDFLRERAAGLGLLVVVIEHNMDFIMSLAARIVVMHQGRVLDDGTPAQMQRSPRVLEAYLN
jgi:ABC-type branched-subunit amino acid transport system ATPase component